MLPLSANPSIVLFDGEQGLQNSRFVQREIVAQFIAQIQGHVGRAAVGALGEAAVRTRCDRDEAVHRVVGVVEANRAAHLPRPLLPLGIEVDVEFVGIVAC